MTMNYNFVQQQQTKNDEASSLGAFAQPWLRPNGATVVEPSGQPLRHLVRAGRVFTGNMAAAGAVIPIFSNTAQVCGLWNPSGNDKVLNVIAVNLTWVDTTGATGGYVIAATLGAPAALATGAKITAFTDGVLGTTIFNNRMGLNTGPSGRFTPSAATVTAPIIYRHLGLNQDVAAATAAVTIFNNQAHYEFNGDLQVYPGNAIWIAGNIATLKKIAASIIWAEEDV